MKSFSNTYIFLFSLIMVTIVAVLLSFVSMQLKPRQQANIEVEKKQNILKSVHEAKKVDEVKDLHAYINEEFSQFITNSYVVDFTGDTVKDANAFEIMLEMNEEIKKPQKDRDYPIFVYTGQGGVNEYVVPVRGKGLWGPIWGYIAIESDLNTIGGAIFDDESETPGLGAQIATEPFQKQFEGKTIFDKEGKFVSIEVVKGGAPPEDMHGVDAISGGTLTSKGLQAMLFDCLGGYTTYFTELRKKQGTE